MKYDSLEDHGKRVISFYLLPVFSIDRLRDKLLAEPEVCLTRESRKTEMYRMIPRAMYYVQYIMKHLSYLQWRVRLVVRICLLGSACSTELKAKKNRLSSTLQRFHIRSRTLFCFGSGYALRLRVGQIQTEFASNLYQVRVRAT